jgi:hypothetical protein
MAGFDGSAGLYMLCVPHMRMEYGRQPHCDAMDSIREHTCGKHIRGHGIRRARRSEGRQAAHVVWAVRRHPSTGNFWSTLFACHASSRCNFTAGSKRLQTINAGSYLSVSTECACKHGVLALSKADICFDRLQITLGSLLVVCKQHFADFDNRIHCECI